LVDDELEPSGDGSHLAGHDGLDRHGVVELDVTLQGVGVEHARVGDQTPEQREPISHPVSVPAS